MKRAIDKFGRIILDGGVGFLFSVMECRLMEPIIIPIDAVIDAEADVEFEAVEVEEFWQKWNCQKR